MLVFASVPHSAYVVTQGAPKRRISADLGERWFCERCGTQLALLADNPDTIDITVASLDEPQAVAPSFHIWFERRIGWFDTTDALPRHARSRPV